MPRSPHTMIMQLTRELMLDRMMAGDSSYDRRFITGVLSTGIYCLPSCRARKPKPENIRFFSTPAEAQAAGLRACKKCRPDEFLAGEDADLDRLEAAVHALGTKPGEFPGVAELCARAEMGVTKLFESMRRHYHTTPGDLMARLRVEAACRRLSESDEPVAEIAFEVGFESLSTFYERFGALTGMTPTAYRRLLECPRFTIDLPDGYRTAAVLAYFGRDPESVCEQVDGSRLKLAVELATGPALVTLEFAEGRVTVDVDGGSALEAHAGVVRMLGLHQEPRGFEQLALKLGHPELIAGREGLRVPLTFAPYDALIWSILGQQVNLRFAYALRRRLCELTGTGLGEGLVSPPTAKKVALLEVEDLLPLQFSWRKAEYLIGVSRLVAEGQVSLDRLGRGSVTRAERCLTEVRGLGPWSVHYILMRGFGFADCVPVGDTGLSSALQRLFALEERPDAAKTRELTDRFAPYRSFACLHLWQSLKFES